MTALRRFLVVGHTQTTDPGFRLDDLTGGAGRLDVLARAVTAAFCTSHGVRTDTECWVVIDHPDVHEGPRTVRFHGDTLRNLNPDERSTAALFRKAFAADVVDDGVFESAHPGVEVAWCGFEEAMTGFAAAGPVWVLDQAGHDVRTMAPAPGAGFVLSDHRPFEVEQRALLDRLVAGAVSVGPLWLQGHAALLLVHDALDRQ